MGSFRSPPGEIFRGQLDAETGRPAPGRFGKIRVLQVEICSGLTAPRPKPGNSGCGVERLFLTRPRCTLKRFWLSETPPTFSLRKEVIQPQVLLRLPCYDFTPITSHTLDGYLLAVELPASSTTGFRDVTGGVYKARERIHRSVMICDY